MMTSRSLLPMTVFALYALLCFEGQAAQPRNLEEALLNYTWEWTHAPRPPDMLTFQNNGIAACARFAWHWKITGDRTALGYDAIEAGNGKGNTGFKVKLTFDPTFTTLDGVTDNGRYHYTGRRLIVSGLQSQAVARAVTSSNWSWVVLQANKDPWDERRFATDGTATAWRRGEMLVTGRWEVVGPRTVRIQNGTQNNVHLLTFDPNFSGFEGVDDTGGNHYRGARQAGVAAQVSPSLPSIQSDANQARIEVLKDHASNATEWVLSPLDQALPADIRENLTNLREDLLDEAKRKPAANADAYAMGAQLCGKLLTAIAERSQASVQAGYTEKQADANMKVDSQSLRTSRNYMMSWPQYARETDERAELMRRQLNSADLQKERSKVDWAARAAVLHNYLDDLYRQFREKLR